MRTKILFRMAASAVTALLAMACIYPYPVEIERGGEYPLVVEGDILIGWTTTVKLSHVRPFNLTDYKSIPVVARGYVEGEDGSRVEGTSDYAASTSEKGILYFDTSDLRKDQRYRLHVETFPQEGGESHVFESAWLMPCPAPTIDALSYSRNADFRELWIGLSMHCNGAHHFRWSFNETWEYHSDIHSYLDYIPSKAYWDEYTGNWETEGGHYQEIFPGNYYCWKSYEQFLYRQSDGRPF